MYKSVLALILVSLFIGCATPKSSVLSPNQKAFAEEDTYIMFALRAEQIQDHKSASAIFATLYKKSSKIEYLYRSLENDLVGKESERVIQRVEAFAQNNPEDTTMMRLKVVALFEQERFFESESLAVKLAHKTEQVDDYLLVSDIYIKNKKYDIALRYLESAYAKEYDEKILDKMSIILYVNLNQKKEAIAYLETHMRIHGGSELICKRLLGIYSNENNIDGLLQTYLRLYKIDSSKSVATKIVQIYTYKRDFLHLSDFLEESRSDDKRLLQLYSASKNYKKAYPLAEELYQETADIHFLAQSAIYEYESAKDKNAPELLKSVTSKLEKYSQTDREPLYLNYLGYLLIDHEIDIKRGMAYVDETLKQEPNSGYYLDSLAWGHYKLGECKKAKQLMNRVLKLEGGDDPEVMLHLKQIEQCIKIKKGRK